MTTATPTTHRPGWHPDPWTPGHRRWHDGTNWTTATQPGPPTTPPPPTAPPPPLPRPTPARVPVPRWMWATAAAILAVFALGATSNPTPATSHPQQQTATWGEAQAERVTACDRVTAGRTAVAFNVTDSAACQRAADRLIERMGFTGDDVLAAVFTPVTANGHTMTVTRHGSAPRIRITTTG